MDQNDVCNFCGETKKIRLFYDNSYEIVNPKILCHKCIKNVEDFSFSLNQDNEVIDYRFSQIYELINNTNEFYSIGNSDTKKDYLHQILQRIKHGKRNMTKDEIITYTSDYFIKKDKKRLKEINDAYENKNKYQSRLFKNNKLTKEKLIFIKKRKNTLLFQKYQIEIQVKKHKEIVKDIFSLEIQNKKIRFKKTSFPSKKNKSTNNRVKYKRKTIPKNVQREVWRRDEAKCVYCESNEKLEFDHIIPISKGGSNTSRNIQLLCEKCNRKKSNKI